MTQNEDSTFNYLLARTRGHQLAALIQLAGRWDLADRVGDGCDLASLAVALEANRDALRRMIRALAAFELFHIDERDFITPTTASRHLMGDARSSLLSAAKFWAIPATWVAWANLERSIKTGRCAFEDCFNQSFFSYLEAHPQDHEIFNAFMAASPDDRHTAVVSGYDFSRFTRVVDVGGGNGALLAAILSAHPGPQGVLFDRMSVVQDVSEIFTILQRENRCEIITGDFFDCVPPSGDIYILCQILHDWDESSQIRIIKNVRMAVPQGATLLIIERLLDSEHGTVRCSDYLSDIEMLVLHGSAEKSADEYRRVLKVGGFCIQNILRTASPFVILESVAA